MKIVNFNLKICESPAKPGISQCGLVALVCLILTCCTSALAAAEAPIESRPYRVRVQVGFGSGPQFDDHFRRTVLREIAEGIERYVGELWQAEVSEELGQVFSSLAALKRLEASALPPDAFDDELQKVYLLHVGASGAAFRSTGREWDLQLRQLGPLATGAVCDSREVAESLLALLNDLFRPVAEIERSRSGTNTLRAWGGRFHPPDARWEPLPSGKTFEVFYCYLDKGQAIERIQQVPWTYVVAEHDAVRGQSDCAVTSGLRVSLGARRHRIQTVALGINGLSAGTKLTLVTRPPARKLLAGVEVELSPVPNPARDPEQSLPEQPDNNPPDQEPQSVKPPRLVADRNGFVFVSASAVTDGRPIWLLVHSGPVLLARVPFVPGSHSSATLELPDDSLRLQAEGDIALVQARLVDTVARRAVLMALAKNRAKASQWEAMDAALKELQETRQASSFAAEISAIRISAVKAARARRDKSTEQRVSKLCSETLELVSNYLDEEKLTELRSDLNELRQMERDQAALEAGDQKPAPVKKKKSVAPQKKVQAAPPAVPPSAPGF
jgi:hypothetical protein